MSRLPLLFFTFVSQGLAQPTWDPFEGFRPEGVGKPDHDWILHITDIPYFFGSGESPQAVAGYDSFYYEDGSALLVEYRTSKGKVYERISEWTASAEEKKEIEQLLKDLHGLSKRGKTHSHQQVKKILHDPWEQKNILLYGTVFATQSQDGKVQIELFDLPELDNLLPDGFWERSDILRPLPALFGYEVE